MRMALVIVGLLLAAVAATYSLYQSLSPCVDPPATGFADVPKTSFAAADIGPPLASTLIS